MIAPRVYYEPGKTIFHCQGVGGPDYTLCGFSLDGAQGSISEVKNKVPKIDCSQCIAIINFCRNISRRSFWANA